MNESRTDIAIRRADASDARALWRLAALDNAAAPHAGPDVLVAEVAGRIVAAVHGDRAIADPFQRTAELVELLRLRVAQVTRVERRERSRRGRRPRASRVVPHPLPQV
jgi:hypothetical protein